MNERIVELAKEAGAIPIHGDPKNRALVGLDNIEKFAELIIQDCNSAILNMPRYFRDKDRRLEEAVIEDCARVVSETFRS